MTDSNVLFGKGHGVCVHLCDMLLDISLAPTGGGGFHTLLRSPDNTSWHGLETSLCNQERSTWTKPDLLTPPIPAEQSSVNLSETFKTISQFS